MTHIGVRLPGPVPRLEGRTPADYARELHAYLDDLQGFADAVNVVISQLDINVGGGTTTVEGLGGDGGLDALMLMGG